LRAGSNCLISFGILIYWRNLIWLLLSNVSQYPPFYIWMLMLDVWFFFICCLMLLLRFFFLALTTSWTFWEDFTCLDISQCLLNKSILSVAAKYVDSGLSGCLVQFLVLGTKVEFHFSCLQFVDIHVWFCLVVCQFLTLLRLCVH
jgi:hypothetical protein